jgi:hypothetical protein
MSGAGPLERHVFQAAEEPPESDLGPGLAGPLERHVFQATEEPSESDLGPGLAGPLERHVFQTTEEPVPIQDHRGGGAAEGR